MARRVIRGAAALGLWALSGAAWASGDSSCYASWKLFDTARDCASRAMIAPSNDTRVNMLLLQRDHAGLGLTGLSYPKDGWNAAGYGHTFYDWGMLSAGLFPPKPGSEDAPPDSYVGSRCDDLAARTSAFSAVMAGTSGLPGGERDKLTVARARLDKICELSAAAIMELRRYHPAGEAKPASPPPPLLPEWPAGIASVPGRHSLPICKPAMPSIASSGTPRAAASLRSENRQFRG